MAKVDPAPEPTLDAEVRLLAVEQRLAALDTQQQTHQQAMEQLTALIKEHLQDTGNDPYRIALLEQVTGGLTQIVERIYAAVQSMAQSRRF